CDDILEEHHDQLVDVLVVKEFNQNERTLADKFCTDTTNFCTAEQLTDLFNLIPPSPSPESDEENEEFEDEPTTNDTDEPTTNDKVEL
ncbi:unnamed protein product, partial [Didymodactylos carnosus]